MNPNYTFSPDDIMYPVYCRECRNHTARTALEIESGLCPVCVAANQEKEAAHIRALADKSAQRANVDEANRNASTAAYGTFSGILAAIGVLIVFGSIAGCTNGHTNADVYNANLGIAPAAAYEIPGMMRNEADHNGWIGVMIGSFFTLPYFALRLNSKP